MEHARPIAAVVFVLAALTADAAGAGAPYPRSQLITDITWQQGSYQQGGAGGDLWPVTWGPDDRVYTAWGDGVVGCPTKVSYGVAALAGAPSADLATVGCGPAGIRGGKIGSLLFVGGVLYASVYLQNRPWPRSDTAIWSSRDGGRNWLRPTWVFPGTLGALHPGSFVNFGRDYAGSRDAYVYRTASRRVEGETTELYLVRAPRTGLTQVASYRYYAGRNADGVPVWSREPAMAEPIFSDPNGVDGVDAVWVPSLGRYLLTVGHGHGGQVGLFEGPQMWGPWRTVSYEERWLGITGGEFLGLRFPTKWITDGGRTLWGVFSCWSNPATLCAGYHDRFNLMRASLTVAAPPGG